MQTEFLFNINDTFALLKDPLQFIVAKPRTGRKASWILVSFIREGRESLLRDLRRRGILPTPEALDRIERDVPSRSELLVGSKDRQPLPSRRPIEAWASAVRMSA
ncbi:hypothetical protein E5163_12455 [Marinicauda algicola]|uniref:Uncharacterized protein n=1 Tax=Marinicauda algicola TaxID=2029849 RepID=A0A4S2GZH8_9PROT|nr:hypothetical protein [Marinicauda algicola]TGY88615.1 hypothetical protein E5163_12455 [Marinicauda algicola]